MPQGQAPSGPEDAQTSVGTAKGRFVNPFRRRKESACSDEQGVSPTNATPATSFVQSPPTPSTSGTVSSFAGSVSGVVRPILRAPLHRQKSVQVQVPSATSHNPVTTPSTSSAGGIQNAHASVNVPMPNTVRITRRHTEHAAALRRMPAHVNSVSRYPEAVVMPVRSRSGVVEDDPSSNSIADNLRPPSPEKPLSAYPFRLDPLKLPSTGVSSGTTTTITTATQQVRSLPSVSEPSKSKTFSSTSHTSEARVQVSRHRVIFKCLFVVVFLSIPVIIFVVMMALSGGFAPFQPTNDNSTFTNGTFLASTPPSSWSGNPNAPAEPFSPGSGMPGTNMTRPL